MQNSQEYTCAGANKFACQGPVTLLKRDFSTDVFLWFAQYSRTPFYEAPRWLLLVFKSFATLFTSLFWLRPFINKQKKSKFLTLPPWEHATVHFSRYPPPLPIHAYTKWFIVKKEKLSTPLPFSFILKKWTLTLITLVNNVSHTK